MTAEEWERIKSIFDGALHLPEQQRPEYLSSACGGHEDVRDVVTKLLHNYDAVTVEGWNPGSLSAPPPVFQPGQLVADRFRVVRLIGAGGMGEVYEVFDERLARRVALKTIRPEFNGKRASIERFKREVWVPREIAHPGICRVYDLVEHRDPLRPDSAPTSCLTMALLDGENLQAVVNRRRPMQLHEARIIAIQVCQALAALHQHGIVHRDLKPSNIMLVYRDGVPEPKAVLTDFGLARPLASNTLTAEAGEQQPGAPYFQAPELLKGERETFASDIYALGLVLDEMVTPTRAFRAESLAGLYWAKLRETPIPPSARAPALPLQWQRIIEKCLRPNPDGRYKSALDIVKDLESQLAPARWQLWTFRWHFFRHHWKRQVLIGSVLLTCVPVALFPRMVWSQAPASVIVSSVQNTTGRREFDPIAVGTSAELLRRLSRSTALQVYQAGQGTERSPALRERAAYRIQSWLQVHGQRCRLAVRLVQNRDDRVLWSDTVDVDPADPVAMQQHIADAAVRALETSVRPVPGRLLRQAREFVPGLRWLSPGIAPARLATRSNPAFQNYFRAKFLLEDRTPKSALMALELLRRAVADDPEFALAWAAMADTERVLMDYNADQADLLPRAREHAERAVSIDPDLPESHATLGAVRQLEWRWQESGQEYQKAIAIAPRFANVRRQYGGLLLQLGRYEEALESMRETLELDPLDYPAQSAYGFALLYSGHFREAANHLEGLLKRRDLLPAHAVLGQAYAMLAATEHSPNASLFANRALREAVILEAREMQDGDNSSGDPRKWCALVYALTYASTGQKDRVVPWLNLIQQAHRQGRVSAFSVAIVHAALHDYDRALDYLDISAAYRERELTNVKVAPFFAGFRDHPRFQRLLSLMQLPLN